MSDINFTGSKQDFEDLIESKIQWYETAKLFKQKHDSYNLKEVIETFRPIIDNVCLRYEIPIIPCDDGDVKNICILLKTIHDKHIDMMEGCIEFKKLHPFVKFGTGMHDLVSELERDLTVLIYLKLQCRNDIKLMSMKFPIDFAFFEKVLSKDITEEPQRFQLEKMIVQASFERKLEGINPHTAKPMDTWTEPDVQDIAVVIANTIDSIVKEASGDKYTKDNVQFFPLSLVSLGRAISCTDFKTPITQFRTRFGLIDKDGNDLLKFDPATV